MSSEALAGLVDLLDLEPIEVNIFRGTSPDEDRQRVFGGQVAGQALVAAARTVDDGFGVHSLHAYFLRPGDPNVPILYEVDRIRDGRSFVTRRVVAIQHGRAIFNLAASFHVHEDGFEHQADAGLDEIPGPEELPDFAERMAPYLSDEPWFHRPRPIDIRYVDWNPPDRSESLEARQRVWLRADGTLDDDPVIHQCILTYASDMTVLDTALLPHGGSWHDPKLFMASLDHAMWFHRPFRVDEWLLYDQDSPTAANGRSLGRGLIFDADGNTVVSVVQEGLLRHLR